MCGIFGYTGSDNATDHVVYGLKQLEYRGYDSAGIAIHKGSGIQTIKSPGRVLLLEVKAKGISSNCAIGHTRWATHGLPTEANAHPHTAGRFSIVHNGIIENYLELKKELIDKGAIFLSETDSEVIAHLFDNLYDNDLLTTMDKVVKRLKGAYAIAVICSDYPDRMLAACKDSPLIMGRNRTGGFISSDMNALQGLCDDVIVLSDGEYGIIINNEIQCYSNDLKVLKKKRIDISALKSRALKSNFSSHMMSEIYEIPRAVSDTIENYEVNDLPEGLRETLQLTKRVMIVACGTAYNAGMAGKIMLEKLVKIPVTVEYASEFRYLEPVMDSSTLIIAISQSGETADTIAAVRLAQSKGIKVLSVVNVDGSTLTRSSDFVMRTYAGAEIAVAATKSYNSQVTVLAILASKWSNNANLMKEIKRLPALTEDCIIRSSSNDLPYSMFNLAEKVFFIGRLSDYTVAMEGSLKLKEISYIMSEGYAAGELKHGTLALIDKGTPVVTIITSRAISGKTMNAIHEVKARGANVLLITSFTDIAEEADCKSFIIPAADELLMPAISVIPLQFIAHEISHMRGCDPDRPRNLAKSVTVE